MFFLITMASLSAQSTQKGVVVSNKGATIKKAWMSRAAKVVWPSRRKNLRSNPRM
jgi:hypothetical protein